MLEAEINPSGDVIVEGHHVGALEGFRFTADQTADGEDAKAVKAAAQKALASEFETRAERFAVAANGDLALASDGLLRWIGAPVATLAAGEDDLVPRVILLADEHLTGPARDKVAARAERFARYQIETLLKPLFDLRNADQLTGMARGIAFRLVENFGILNRRDVADDVKSLDQEARGALRRLGVRFGAFHIFVPALLKPGPAGLVTLLWSLRNDGKDKPGFGDVVHALASGRTSVVVDPAFEPAFYRLAGFRVLGRRAVRIDILERLADLIRPALSWRAETGPRPDGAYDGAAFFVTPAMMSILGATADDMEEILKGLGYRAEAKPAADVQARLDALDEAERQRAAAKAAEAAAKAAAAEAPATDAEAAPVAEPEAVASTDGVADQAAELPTEGPAAETATEAEVADQTADLPEESPAPDAPAAAQDADAQAAAPSPAEAGSAPPEATEQSEPATAEGGAEPSATAAAELVAEPPADAAEEPKPILLWRPMRFEGRQRHGQRDQRGKRDQNRGGQNNRRGGQRGADGAEGGRSAQPEGRGRFEGKPKGKGGGRRDERRGDWNADRGKERQGGRPRDKAPPKLDPDSPFAKLAALRDQLKK